MGNVSPKSCFKQAKQDSKIVAEARALEMRVSMQDGEHRAAYKLGKELLKLGEGNEGPRMGKCFISKVAEEAERRKTLNLLKGSVILRFTMAPETVSAW